MLQFDAETTRLFDSAYSGTDIRRRRQANLDALAPRRGDTVLDLGCGNGHLTAELARAVGQTGQVIGLDPSDDMMHSARTRCADYPWVSFHTGTATDMPLASGAVDRAVSVQVFEYVEDIPAALAETRRVLKPGGRLVIGDMHFDSWIWHSDDPARMARMMAAFDHHLVHRRLPQTLPGALSRQGFQNVSCRPVTFCDTRFRPDGLAQMLVLLMAQYAVTNGHVPEPEATAWAEEQTRLAAEQRFFFSVTHFVTAGDAPRHAA